MSWISLDFVEFGENYEMYSEFPYDIRHKYKLNILNGYINDQNYKIYVFTQKCKSKKYRHHRLIYYALVKPFDLNDKRLEIDHINHQRDDNHVENLRLVSPVENMINCSKIKGISYIFVNDLPDKVVVCEEHKIYYSPSSNNFYRDLVVHFKQMYEKKSYAHFEIRYAYKGKQYNINTTKWRKENGY